MGKISVLHISPNGQLYGTERHILSILKHADRNRIEHSVATPVYGNFNSILDDIKIKYFIAGRHPGKKFKLGGMIESGGISKLVRLLRKGHYDIVHTHLNSYGGFLAKIITNSKIVHTRHGVFWTEDELENISAISKYFQKKKNNIFDITVAIGEYEKDTLINLLGYSPDKIRLTYNGVDINDICSKIDNKVNKKVLFDTDDILIGAVGRLEKQKGFHMFIEAARLVVEYCSNVKFVIIGNGSLRNELISLKNDLGLHDKFEFIDYKADIYNYMNCFDIMIQTSLWEGISYVVLEAMALGKPVIALTTPNTSGVKEIILENDTGYLIDRDYVINLKEKILTLVNDRRLAVKMGEMGKIRALTHFSEQRTARDNEQVYEELVSNL